MSKLVVYYSRAGENLFYDKYIDVKIGTTERAAKLIARIVRADLFKIEQKIPYADDYATCAEQAKKDKESNARPELVSLPKNIEKYDEIFIGYPIYFETMPMAVYTFLESCNLAGKTIHPFCTHEGSGLCSTVEEIRSMVNDAKVTKGIDVFGSDFDYEKFRIMKWEPVYKYSEFARIDKSHNHGGVGGHSTHYLYNMTDLEIAEERAFLNSKRCQESAKEGKKLILKIICFIFLVVLGTVFLGVFALIPILLYITIMFVIPSMKKKKKSKDRKSDAGI